MPLKFNMGELLGRAGRKWKDHVGSVTLSLPFLSFAVNPKNRERQIAREIVIRLKDRRVLSARECCDNCIDRALESLQEIRRTLLDNQVDLSDVREGRLYRRRTQDTYRFRTSPTKRIVTPPKPYRGGIRKAATRSSI